MRKTGKLKKEPPVKPVRSIEVPIKVTKKKILLIAALFAVGITLIVWALVNFLTVPKGWQMIEPPDGLENTCVYEISLRYALGESGEKTNREKTAVSELYVKAAADAYRIFSETEMKDVKNIYYINRHPGETVKVDPALYQAFSLLTKDAKRALYLGPIYENNRMILSEKEDVLAGEYDPVISGEAQIMYEKLLGYLHNAEHISLELLGDNQVRLTVSEEYRQYARELGFEDYISLDWMRNAFVTDYIADALAAKGYYNGILSSYDGYVRNLDQSGRQFELALFDGSVNRNYRVGTMQYTGVGAMIWMRNYPISLDEEFEYHYWNNGRVTHTRLDPADGMPKTACSDFVVYSRSLSCAQILMEAMDVYVADTLDWKKAGQMMEAGVEMVAVTNKTIYASDKNVTFSNLVYGKTKSEGAK